MTLEQLGALTECEHVTQAFCASDMVQSAMRKSLAALEGEIEIRSFDRMGRNITLSPLGVAYRECACELLDHAERIPTWAFEAGAHGKPATTMACAIARTAIAAPVETSSARDRSSSEPVRTDAGAWKEFETQENV